MDDAVHRINRFYYRYHSLRYIVDQLVIRLASSLDEEKIRKLKTAYNDILLPQEDIYLSGPLPEEIEEPEISHLSRLIMDFNRIDSGRLRDFIDEINRDYPISIIS